MNLKPLCGAVAVALGLFLPAPALVHAETLAPQLPDFTYQGRLEDNGVAVNGPVNPLVSQRYSNRNSCLPEVRSMSVVTSCASS